MPLGYQIPHYCRRARAFLIPSSPVPLITAVIVRMSLPLLQPSAPSGGAVELALINCADRPERPLINYFSVYPQSFSISPPADPVRKSSEWRVSTLASSLPFQALRSPFLTIELFPPLLFPVQWSEEQRVFRSARGRFDFGMSSGLWVFNRVEFTRKK